MPSSFNGIGTKYYGKRDFRPDGSYVTTEWLTFIHLPILPIGSVRVVEGESTGYTFVVYSSSKTEYAILEDTGLNFKQVGSVYAYVACFLLIVWSKDIFGKEYDAELFLPGWTAWLFIVPYGLLPTALRWTAKRRMRLMLYQNQSM